MTLLLDEETHQAAKQLALLCGCSTSEAIRRSVLSCRQRYAPERPTPEERARRTEALRKLIELSDGQDARAELDELKRVDESTGFSL
ncbi:MAG: hypothetical protein AB1758_08495 [Candidatus Eremiobacterota bacterium]